MSIDPMFDWKLHTPRFVVLCVTASKESVTLSHFKIVQEGNPTLSSTLSNPKKATQCPCAGPFPDRAWILIESLLAKVSLRLLVFGPPQ